MLFRRLDHQTGGFGYHDHFLYALQGEVESQRIVHNHGRERIGMDYGWILYVHKGHQKIEDFFHTGYMCTVSAYSSNGFEGLL